MTTRCGPTTAAAAGDFLLGGDLRISRLGFGAMRLALGGRAREPAAGVAILRRAVELGVSHIDTAASYGFGDLHAHEMIRQALSPYPDDLVIVTKVGPLLEGGGAFADAATAQRRLVEQDLRRLGRDHLDLVYLRVGGMGKPGGESIGEHLVENITAAGIRLTAEDLVELAGQRSPLPPHV